MLKTIDFLSNNIKVDMGDESERNIERDWHDKNEELMS